MEHSIELANLAETLMQSRQTTLPRRLVAPGPDEAQLARVLDAAASAPDHGQLLPWRLVLVDAPARVRLAEAFAAALLERDASATNEQVAQAREKAYRAPVLVLVVVDGQRGDPAIPLHERIVSAGCAVQNMLLVATALGFGSALTSGKAMASEPLRTLFALAPGEQALCFMSIGTVAAHRAVRTRPSTAQYVTRLGAD